MTNDMEWSLDFCLACDRQTDGGVYCGEACRLTEYEKANVGPEAGSPASQRDQTAWPTNRPVNNNFYLPPAYDFRAYRTQLPHASPGPKPPQSSSSGPQTLTSSKSPLTPSSSQSSLFSMKSASSMTSEPLQLSEESRRELRAYASAFDQSRYQRRQSSY